MQISEVSEKYKISPDTLRYYERIGLIPPVNRNRGGIRDYSEQDVRWVLIVRPASPRHRMEVEGVEL